MPIDEESATRRASDAETPRADDERRGRRGRTARKSHRPIERHGDLRRQGHRQPVLEVRPARPRLPLPGVRAARRRPARSGRRRPTGRRRAGAPRVRRRAAVYNVIDSRQAYLQQLLKQALATMGFTRAGRAAPRTSRTRWSRCRTRPRARSATRHRRGRQAVRRGVRPQGPGREGRRPARSADRHGAGEVAARNPELATARRAADRRAIAVAAVRYFLVKFSRGKVIAFDIDEALSFEGETGPYLQYAVVRANNIFAKLARTRRA